MVAQIVFQCSYALFLRDLEILAVLEHQIGFIYLLFCIYYGVEHYIQKTPKSIQRVPSSTLKLCFTKALNKLGQRLACDPTPIQPYKQQIMHIPSGSCMLEVRYYCEDDIEAYRGAPFEKNQKFTINVEIDVHTFDLLPVVAEEHRKAYINKHYAHDSLAHKLIFPPLKEGQDGKWLTTERTSIYEPIHAKPQP